MQSDLVTKIVLKSNLGVLSTALIAVVAIASLGSTALPCSAGDHYAHFNPVDPRPDFFAFPIYNAWVPYRKAYNRPTYVGGHVAAVIEPTSQEAMAWKIAKANGDYRYHRPGYIPTYYYPKPWEALSVEARPNPQTVTEPDSQADKN